MTEVTTENQHKLHESHHRFIQQMLASFIVSPAEIARRLNSDDIADEYGFEAVEVSRQWVHTTIKGYDIKEIAKWQAIYLSDFVDTPLAYKKNRLVELTKIYIAIDTLKYKKKQGAEVAEDYSDAAKMKLKLGVLKQMKDEMGEDIEKLADALRAGSGSVVVNMTKVQMQEIAVVLTEEAGGFIAQAS